MSAGRPLVRNFSGAWRLDSDESESLDPIFKELKVNWLKRQLFHQSDRVTSILHTPTQLVVEEASPAFRHQSIFTLHAGVQATTQMDGAECLAECCLRPGSLVIEIDSLHGMVQGVQHPRGHMLDRRELIGRTRMKRTVRFWQLIKNGAMSLTGSPSQCRPEFAATVAVHQYYDKIETEEEKFICELAEAQARERFQKLLRGSEVVEQQWLNSASQEEKLWLWSFLWNWAVGFTLDRNTSQDAPRQLQLRIPLSPNQQAAEQHVARVLPPAAYFDWSLALESAPGSPLQLQDHDSDSCNPDPADPTPRKRNPIQRMQQTFLSLLGKSVPNESESGSRKSDSESPSSKDPTDLQKSLRAAYHLSASVCPPHIWQVRPFLFKQFWPALEARWQQWGGLEQETVQRKLAVEKSASDPDPKALPAALTEFDEWWRGNSGDLLRILGMESPESSEVDNSAVDPESRTRRGTETASLQAIPETEQAPGEAGEEEPEEKRLQRQLLEAERRTMHQAFLGSAQITTSEGTPWEQSMQRFWVEFEKDWETWTSEDMKLVRQKLEVERAAFAGNDALNRALMNFFQWKADHPHLFGKEVARRASLHLSPTALQDQNLRGCLGGEADAGADPQSPEVSEQQRQERLFLAGLEPTVACSSARAVGRLLEEQEKSGFPCAAELGSPGDHRRELLSLPFFNLSGLWALVGGDSESPVALMQELGVPRGVQKMFVSRCTAQLLWMRQCHGDRLDVTVLRRYSRPGAASGSGSVGFSSSENPQKSRHASEVENPSSPSSMPCRAAEAANSASLAEVPSSGEDSGAELWNWSAAEAFRHHLHPSDRGQKSLEDCVWSLSRLATLPLTSPSRSDPRSPSSAGQESNLVGWAAPFSAARLLPGRDGTLRVAGNSPGAPGQQLYSRDAGEACVSAKTTLPKGLGHIWDFFSLLGPGVLQQTTQFVAGGTCRLVFRQVYHKLDTPAQSQVYQKLWRKGIRRLLREEFRTSLPRALRRCARRANELPSLISAEDVVHPQSLVASALTGRWRLDTSTTDPNEPLVKILSALGLGKQERNALTAPEVIYDLRHRPNEFAVSLISEKIVKVFGNKSLSLLSDNGSSKFFASLHQLVLPTDGRYHRVSQWRVTGTAFAKAVPRPLSVMREVKFRVKEDHGNQQEGVQKLVEVFELDLHSSDRLRHRIYLHVRQANRQVSTGWEDVVLEAEQGLLRIAADP